MKIATKPEPFGKKSLSMFALAWTTTQSRWITQKRNKNSSTKLGLLSPNKV